ncbi:Fibronectin type-III domain-containing protein [Candidatus Southlakia epibionticum]|uniref:Fibronectin type-III domain-containing protein n=2 Tax=Candidatus Southlakia epibionticum TaxID=3043284 RepID=A0ABY8WVB7_9BACT|nr:Fibronectin type-III domain-containing protein [Candidatus Saccharimonadaceae bacterium ML1]
MRKIHAILEALYWRDVTSLYIKPTWQRRLPAVGVGVAMFTVLAFGIVRLMDGFLVSALAVRAVQVSGGSYHSLALSSSGAVYAWGWNGSGQLGNGTTADSHIPVAVKVVGTPMAGKNITQISAGGSFNDGHSLARASDGTVYAWGRGVYGQLGNGTTTDSNVPVAVKTVGTPMAAKTITQISAGAGHSLALASDGTVYAWGQNTYGQLGNNVTTNSSSPVAVQTTGTPMAGKSIVNIAAGGYHSLALADDGTVYAWGYNPTGQLGNGATVDSRTPVAVKATGTPMAGKNIIKIAAGVHNSLALASDGTVYTWGRGEFGQLGNGTTTDSNIPVAVKTVGTPMASKTIIGISGGPAYMLAVDSNGKVYGWGRNANGQLGSLSHTDSSVPVASQIPAGKSIIQVSAGGWDGSHSLALTHDNIVYGRGRNSNGQLGNNSTSDSLAAVVAQLNLMDTPSTPTQVVVEPGNAKATISWQSPVVTGGKSIVGYVLRYRTIGAVDWTTVDVAATVTSHAITGLTNDQIYQTQVAAKTATGTGDFSSIVLATPHAKPTITNVSPAIGPVAGGQNVTITGTNFMPKGKKIVQTANGSGYSLALASDGTVYAWGQNNYGQLGNGTTTDSNVPVAVKTVGTPMEGKKIIQVSTKVWYSLALASDGTVYAWGLNGSGQLGDGTITHSSTPVAVKTIGTPMEGKTIVGIAAGASHSLALASDGKIYVWGGNAYGQFGNGVTTTSSVVPVAVKTVGTPMDNKKIIQIHAGYYHSLALASDGTVYAWGQNTYGQLGNNTMINANAPVSVQTIGTPMAGKIIIQLAAGNSQSVALASDGTIYAWGWNMYGQLGNGTTVDTRIPVAVKVTGTPMAGKVIAQVAASNAHTLAVASDGTVYDWGWNQYGQLGNNTTTNSSVPVAVQTTGTPMVGKVISQVTSGGSANSLALASDGTMYTWGWGQHGQLGNGTIGTDAKTPLAVSTTPPSALAPSAPKVTFDGIEATNVTIVNSTTITATTPAHAAGLVDVAIDLGDGDELYKAVKTSSYRYATVPDVPTNLATAPLDNAVRLTWTAPANNGGTPITDYVIQYSADGGITWSTYSHIASTSTTVTIPFLTPTTYTFRVAAVNAIGMGAYSATATGQIRYITLSAPTSVDIAVTPAGGTKMSSKSANVLVATNAATGYKLSLSTQNANRNLTNGSQTIMPTAGTQTAPATLSGSAWGYRVNGIGNFGSTTTAENNVASSAYTWAGVPDHTAPHVIRTTAIANPTAETTTVWYGVSATGSQQSGIYTATVTYTAINN